nr:unnamed protein product [Callosobruchus analis]
MESGDPLKQFLKSTGWSCDELLQKLLQIKSKATTSHETKDKPTEKNSLEDNVSNSQSATTPTCPFNTTADKDFSDIDEEEEEVISTHKHIIDEIIEDIADDPAEQKGEQLLAAIIKDCERLKQAPPVIELDSEEDDDDNFEEECYHSDKTTSKANDSDEATRSKSGTDSSIVIEDDQLSDTEKSAARFQ